MPDLYTMINYIRALSRLDVW